MFNVYFFIVAHISKCAGSVIFLNNVRRSEKAVLRLRFVADAIFKNCIAKSRKFSDFDLKLQKNCRSKPWELFGFEFRVF